MSARLRVGVAGVHGHGRSHVDRALALVADVELVAVADPRGGGAVPTTTSVYTDALEMIEREPLDIVVLSTPIHTHLPLAMAALTHGAHVLVEKPPVTSVADHGVLSDAARRAGRAVQVGFQSLASEGIEATRDAAASGEIGEIRHIGAAGLWSRSEEYWARAPWSGHRRVGGVIVADGVVTNPLAHALATALAIGGAERASGIRAIDLDLRRANEISTDDTSSVVLETEGGPRIAAGLAVTARRRHEPYVLVRGTRGEAIYHYTLDLLTIRSTDRPLPRTFAFARHGLLEDLVQHVAAGAALRVPMERTGGFTRVLEEVVASPAPVPVDPARVTRTSRGGETFRAVTGVEEIVERVAWEARTFRDLGGI